MLSCSQCNLVYNDFYRGDIEHIYDQDYYEASEKASPGGYFNYSGMEKAIRKTNQFAISFIERHITETDNLRLLDIGCGYGFFLKQFLGFSSVELTGVEPGKTAAMEASKFINKIINNTFEQAHFEENCQYDFIAAFEVIEHLIDPFIFMRKAHDLLKNNGHLIISTPDIGSIWFKFLKRKWPGIHPFYHNIYFSTKTIKMLGQKCGFEIISINSSGFFYSNMKHIRKRLSELFPYAKFSFNLFKPFDTLTIPFLNGGDLRVIMKKVSNENGIKH